MQEIMQKQQRIRELTKDLIDKVEKIDHKSVKDFILSDLKKIQKREKVFNFISKAIDIIKYQWKTVIFTFVMAVFIYVVFFWLDTVQEIRFEIIYI